MPASQAGYAGSSPVSRSIKSIIKQDPLALIRALNGVQQLPPTAKLLILMITWAAIASLLRWHS